MAFELMEDAEAWVRNEFDKGYIDSWCIVRFDHLWFVGLKLIPEPDYSI